MKGGEERKMGVWLVCGRESDIHAGMDGTGRWALADVRLKADRDTSSSGLLKLPGSCHGRTTRGF
jgi:hypothetical protein